MGTSARRGPHGLAGTTRLLLLSLTVCLVATGCPVTTGQPVDEPEPGATPGPTTPSSAPAGSSLQPAGTTSGPALPLALEALADGTAWLLAAPEATDDPLPALVRIDRQGTELDRLPLAGDVRGLAKGPDDTCWVVGHAPDTLWRVPVTGSPASASTPIALSEAPRSLAWAGNRRLWWSEASASRVVGWHPEATPSVVTWSVPEGVEPFLATGTDSVWVVSRGSRSTWRLDAVAGTLLATLTLEAPAAGPLAVDVNGFAWIAIEARDGGTSLQKLEATRPIRTVTPARSPLNAVEADALGYVWMLSRESSTLMRLVPGTGEQRIFWDGSMVRPVAMGTNETGETWVASPGGLTRFVVGP